MATRFERVHALLPYQATESVDWRNGDDLWNFLTFSFIVIELSTYRERADPHFAFSSRGITSMTHNSIRSLPISKPIVPTLPSLLHASSQLLVNNVNKLPCCLCFLHKLDSVSIHISEQWKFIESFVPKMNQISSVNKENKENELKQRM